MTIWERVQQSFEQATDNLILRLPDILVALIIFCVFWVVAAMVRRGIVGAVKRSKFDNAAGKILGLISFIVIIVLGVFQAASQIGLNLSALGISVGIIGVGVGFALKEVLANFLAGVLFIFTKPFQIGDQIKVIDFEGTIEGIELSGTTIRTYDGRQIRIPNTFIHNNPVTNNTANKRRRSSVMVQLDNSANLMQTQEIILKAVEQCEKVLKDPAPDVLVNQLGSNGVTLEVRIWSAPQQLEMMTTNSEAALAIKEALDANSIPTPMTTQRVRVLEWPTLDQTNEAVKI